MKRAQAGHIHCRVSSRIASGSVIAVQECGGFGIGKGGQFAQQIAHEFPKDIDDTRQRGGGREIKPFDEFSQGVPDEGEHGRVYGEKRAGRKWSGRLRRFCGLSGEGNSGENLPVSAVRYRPPFFPRMTAGVR